MAHHFKFAALMARHRAPLFAAIILALSACDSTNSLSPDANTPVDGVQVASVDDESIQVASVDEPSLASAFAGGIPIGFFHLPTDNFGAQYNGALRTVSPSSIMADLEDIRARGGKVVLNLAGSQKYFKDGNGRFSLTKWQARIARYRGLDLSSYINSGTIVGHYLIDEPYDAHNFAGQAVLGPTVDLMAKYSKGIWPGMATIVRAEPYLLKWDGPYKYLDAAWAQYLYRKGNVNDYLAKNVASAQKLGLGLVVGLNIRDGGVGNKNMTASQVESWGSALLSNSHVCGFISWKFSDAYLNTTSMKNAMRTLRSKAQNRAAKSCRS